MDRVRAVSRKCAVTIVALCLLFCVCTGTETAKTGASSRSMFTLQTGKMLAVIGVTQEDRQPRSTDRKSLDDRRIGFGLTNLLAEVLFDTGKFRLLEEKEVHKRELLENLVQTYWIEPGAQYSAQMLQGIAIQLGVELLAYGSVSHSETSKRSVSFGPFSHHKQKLQVKVNVCLYEASVGGILCREGQGEAQQEGVGVLYEFHADRLDFEKNAAGRATKQAVTSAVQELVVGIQFVP